MRGGPGKRGSNGLIEGRAGNARKEELFTHAAPSKARSVADSLVIKDRNLYLVTAGDGTVPVDGVHGFGLYYKDCRWLDGYELELERAKPSPLLGTDERGDAALVLMTNLKAGHGKHALKKETLSIESRRSVSQDDLCFRDRIEIENHARHVQEFRLRLRVAGDFEDVFEVRSLLPKEGGPSRRRWLPGGELELFRRGADNVIRRARLRFSERIAGRRPGVAEFHVRLEHRERWCLNVECRLHEESIAPSSAPGNVVELRAARDRRPITASWLGELARVSTDSLTVNRVLERSFSDLKTLRSTLLGNEYISAGTPWFAALFGRDSLWTALELLPFDRLCAANTLRLLAKLQADRHDTFRDAEPGKILHEMRVGELAAAGVIPHTPYYGSVDATSLFLIVLSRYTDWAGSTELFEELRGSAEAALEWIDRFSNRDDAGFILYDSKRSARNGLVNQGWKDAGNSILDEKGEIPIPPIALVEVQAYAVEARIAAASLFERTGEPARAEELRRRARVHRRALNQRFWSARKRIFGMALEGRGRLVDVVSSNAGHVLWAGAADATKAAQTVRALMSPGMFAGWGVRTLSADERGFNPLGYHLGTIWPHDNAILAAGFRRYGFDQEALRIFHGITAASVHVRDGRLPELFAGYSRDEAPKPVRYPVACSPQAWAAASYPYLLATLLGLEARGFEGRLELRRPLLPEPVSRIRLEGLRVGNAELDLDVERTRSGGISVRQRGRGVDVRVVHGRRPGGHAGISRAS